MDSKHSLALVPLRSRVLLTAQAFATLHNPRYASLSSSLARGGAATHGDLSPWVWSQHSQVLYIITAVIGRHRCLPHILVTRAPLRGRGTDTHLSLRNMVDALDPATRFTAVRAIQPVNVL